MKHTVNFPEAVILKIAVEQATGGATSPAARLEILRQALADELRLAGRPADEVSAMLRMMGLNDEPLAEIAQATPARQSRRAA